MSELGRLPLEKGNQGRQHVSHDEVIDSGEGFNHLFAVHSQRRWAERYVQVGHYFHVHLAVGINGSDSESSYWCIGCYHPCIGLDPGGEDGYVVRLAGVDREPSE